ncbi:MAG: hypothetical protein WBO12_09710 [Xanthobacteraceae bacterium]
MTTRLGHALIGGTVTWPLAARAQHAERPTVGFLSSQSPDGYGPYADAFRQGSSDAGYAEGQTLSSNTVGREVSSTNRPRWAPSWCIARST